MNVPIPIMFSTTAAAKAPDTEWSYEVRSEILPNGTPTFWLQAWDTSRGPSPIGGMQVEATAYGAGLLVQYACDFAGKIAPAPFTFSIAGTHEHYWGEPADDDPNDTQRR